MVVAVTLHWAEGCTGVHPWVQPSWDGLVASLWQSRPGAQANPRWWGRLLGPPTIPMLESGAALPAAGNLDLPFTAKKFAFLGSTGMLGCHTPVRAAPLVGHPAPTHPGGRSLPPPPHTLAHAWAQPGLLYPQTLFMWHIYSKDWNN